MVEEKRLVHRTLNDWEQFDEIRISTIPRFKTSDLSGDEWRTAVIVSLCFKGAVFLERAFRDIETAVLNLRALITSAEGLSQDYLELESKMCDQKGCLHNFDGRLELKRLTASDGCWLDPAEYALYRYYRKFCLEHINRGDASREDCNDNYIPLDGYSAKDSTNTKTSPAAFGGVINLSKEVKNENQD